MKEPFSNDIKPSTKAQFLDYRPEAIVLRITRILFWIVKGKTFQLVQPAS
uniref:Uncharacterized protein n=1 Tax=Klebsiella pneumoniae TaxID=573 RepID=A0A345WY75_KLEPN|nr:hypothetical protein [Klebsiella pneumoniae]AZZ87194.1 hypothetical protein [Klebsiella pneumoniae]QAR16923.1 hypothetical protein [Klebsiella pneumoniae]UMW89568.1 hypothetical protein [Klebsiella pneumoniae]